MIALFRDRNWFRVDFIDIFVPVELPWILVLIGERKQRGGVVGQLPQFDTPEESEPRRPFGWRTQKQLRSEK